MRATDHGLHLDHDWARGEENYPHAAGDEILGAKILGFPGRGAGAKIFLGFPGRGAPAANWT